MIGASTQHDDGPLPSKASASSADHKHQGCTQTERGNTRGVTSAHILVADYQPQDWMASRHAGIAGSLPTPATCRGSGLGIFPHSHWPFPSLAADRRVLCSSRSIRRNSPARAVTGCAGAFHSANPAGANRLCVRNSTAHQKFVAALTDVPHVTRRLSSSPSSAGFKTSWKDLTCEAQALSSDDKIHD